MVLVDTSIWIDHLNKTDAVMHRLLMEGQVLMHPFVIGEIAMGSMRARETVLLTLSLFQRTVVARDEDVLRFTASHKLFGTGIGYLDAHLLTSALITPDTTLWTKDKRLEAAALDLYIAYRPLLH